MNRRLRNSHLRAALACAVFAVTLLLAQTGSASAALIPRDATEALDNVVLSRGAVYWAGNDGYNAPVYRRGLGSATTETLFSPPAGTFVSSLAATADGIVLVYETERPVYYYDDPYGYGPRPVVRVPRDGEPEEAPKPRIGAMRFSETAAGWSSELIFEHMIDGAAVCQSTARAVGTNAAAEAIVVEKTFTGFSGSCKRLARGNERILAIGAGGTRTVRHTAGAWTDAHYRDSFGSAVAMGGDWLAFDTVAESFFTGGRIENVVTGEFALLDLSDLNGYTELAADGTLLLPSWRFVESNAHLVRAGADGQRLRIGLERKRVYNWHHICGDKLIEIHRRARGRRGGSARFWRVSVRDLAGSLLYTLPVKLRRRTAFETCDADIAIFHRHIYKTEVKRRRGRRVREVYRIARQFPVSLARPEA